MVVFAASFRKMNATASGDASKPSEMAHPPCGNESL